MHNRDLSQSRTTVVGSFIWIGSSAPGCGKYSCSETRYNCSGDKRLSNRIGYGDSLGFGKWMIIDRAVFGLVIVILSLLDYRLCGYSIC